MIDAFNNVSSVLGFGNFVQGSQDLPSKPFPLPKMAYRCRVKLPDEAGVMVSKTTPSIHVFDLSNASFDFDGPYQHLGVPIEVSAWIGFLVMIWASFEVDFDRLLIALEREENPRFRKSSVLKQSFKARKRRVLHLFKRHVDKAEALEKLTTVLDGIHAAYLDRNLICHGRVNFTLHAKHENFFDEGPWVDITASFQGESDGTKKEKTYSWRDLQHVSIELSKQVGRFADFIDFDPNQPFHSSQQKRAVSDFVRRSGLSLTRRPENPRR